MNKYIYSFLLVFISVIVFRYFKCTDNKGYFGIRGYKIPQVGFGTYMITDEAVLEKALDAALEAGYRHIDTATLYNNEHLIGKVLKKWFDSGKLKREDIFITTKLPFCQPPEKVEKYLKESLEKLQLEYVDLYLIHHALHIENWGGGKPLSEIRVLPVDHVATWRAMEEQVDKGRTRTIGVANFNIRQVKRILDNGRIKPASNQVELHVYLQQPELVKYCQKNGIVPVSYHSLGNLGLTNLLKGQNTTGTGNRANLFIDPVVVRTAVKHKKTPPQILLKFLNQKNIGVIPKSVTPSRIKENFNLFDFTLDSDDMKALEALDKGEAGRMAHISYTQEMIDSPEYPYPKEGLKPVYRG